MLHRIIILCFVYVFYSCNKDTGHEPGYESILYLTEVSGNNQTGATGEFLKDSIIVKVMDENKNPRTEIRAEFSVVQGEGSLSDYFVKTNSKGLTGIKWKLGKGAGQVVKVNIPAYPDCKPLYFYAKNNSVLPQDTAKNISIYEVKGNNQKGMTGEFLPDSVIIRIVDKNKNPLANIRVEFKVIFGEGNVTTAYVATDKNGLAAVRWKTGRGPEQILKVTVPENNNCSPVYFYSNNNMIYQHQWTSDIQFVSYNVKQEHDNKILETKYFLTFSDGGNDDTKIIFARMAEESFYELKQLFNIDEKSEFIVQPAFQKIKIFTIKNKTYNQYAYKYGFTLYGIDSPQFINWRVDNFWFRREIKHETMHVVQFLLGAERTGGPYADTWFTEGIAEHTGGGIGDALDTVEKFDNWLSKSTHINPIKIHKWADFPVQYGTAEYYPAFGLAVKYLFDKKGLGKTYNDAKNLLKEMNTLGSFSKAFEKHFGITVDYFETNFIKIIREYLANK